MTRLRQQRLQLVRRLALRADPQHFAGWNGLALGLGVYHRLHVASVLRVGRAVEGVREAGPIQSLRMDAATAGDEGVEVRPPPSPASQPYSSRRPDTGQALIAAENLE
jgi:hypothetical protein